MSADSHTACPNCHPEILGIDEGASVSDVAEDLGIPNEVRENIEYFTEVVNGELFVVFRYDALCWECRWHKEVEMRERLV